jgi:hypothetical protein
MPLFTSVCQNSEGGELVRPVHPHLMEQHARPDRLVPNVISGMELGRQCARRNQVVIKSGPYSCPRAGIKQPEV